MQSQTWVRQAMADKWLMGSTGCFLLLMGIGLFIFGAAIIIWGFFNGLLILNAIIGTVIVLLACWLAKLGSVLTDRASSE